MKRVFNYLILILICLITINVYAYDDYSGGGSGTVGGLGSGQWINQAVGMKVNSVSSSGVIKDTIIFYNKHGINGYQFSNILKPKMYQSKNIKWQSISVKGAKLDYLPNAWLDKSDKIYSLYNLLTKNNYKVLKDIHVKYFSDTFKQGDYLVVEPMTVIGGKYGTAYELANSYGLTSGCSQKSSFCWNYSSAVFTGSSNRRNGGVFYNTLFITKPVLGLTIYTDSNNNYNARRDCFMSKTCGRGIGVFGHNEMYGCTEDCEPPEETPPPTGTNVEVGCLTAKITDKNFESNCTVSVTITNNLIPSSAIQSYTFFAKTGRFIMQRRESDSKIIMFDSSYNEDEPLNPHYIATATVTKVCSKTNSRSSCTQSVPSYPKFTTKIPDFSFCFSGICQDINGKKFSTVSISKSQTTTSDCHVTCNGETCSCSPHIGWVNSRTTEQESTQTFNFTYQLPKVYIDKLTGEMSESEPYGKVEDKDYIIREGIIKDLNTKSGYIDFEIIYNGYTEKPLDSNACRFETEEEIVKYEEKETETNIEKGKKGKLQLEFRAIDPNIPFNRDTKSNWCYNDYGTTDCGPNNSTVNNVITNSPNSYSSVDDVKYTIELDLDSIENIRTYNQTHAYNNNDMVEVENFLTSMKTSGVLVEH